MVLNKIINPTAAAQWGFLLLLFFLDHTRNAQGLFLLYSGITPSSTWGPVGMLGYELGLAACKLLYYHSGPKSSSVVEHMLRSVRPRFDSQHHN